MNFQITIDRLILKLTIPILLLFIFPILLHAASFAVNSTADKVDVNIGDGLCADDSGNCTLRAAIQETNALNGADTINLPAGIYILSIDGVDEDAAAKGDLDITDDLTIEGNSNVDTIVDANQIDRVLSIFGTITVNISGVKVKNGSGNRTYSGGGISNQNGKVYLTNCTISNNDDVWAGGIGNGDEGEMVLLDCIVSDNFSISTGGIENYGKMKLSNCSIVNNVAGDGNGGIDNRGTMTLINSTVSNNSTSSAGGGISNLDTMALINSTVSGNKCYRIQGGGINNEGEIILTNSTVSDNEGGGLRNNSQVKLINSIVASNTDGDCVGQSISLGHNLDSDGSCNLTEPSDLPNTDPLLGEFTDDGTPGRGHFPLLKGSPAIDKGNDDACPPTDQLGNPRVDGDGDGTINCDIGAVEFQDVVLINELVTFEPDPSTYRFNPDSTDCQAGAVGKFSFDAKLTNISEKELSNLNVEVNELTNNNLLLTDDGLIGEGGRFEVPNSDDYADGYLSADEYVDVPFTVCLKIKKPFRFYVNVVGDAAD